MDSLAILRKKVEVYEQKIEDLQVKLSKYETIENNAATPIDIPASKYDDVYVPMNSLWDILERTPIAKAIVRAGLEVYKSKNDIKCRSGLNRVGYVNSISPGQIARIIEYYDSVYIITNNLTYKRSRKYYEQKRKQLINHIKENNVQQN